MTTTEQQTNNTRETIEIFVVAFIEINYALSFRTIPVIAHLRSFKDKIT